MLFRKYYLIFFIFLVLFRFAFSFLKRLVYTVIPHGEDTNFVVVLNLLDLFFYIFILFYIFIVIIYIFNKSLFLKIIKIIYDFYLKILAIIFKRALKYNFNILLKILDVLSFFSFFIFLVLLSVDKFFFSYLFYFSFFLFNFFFIFFFDAYMTFLAFQENNAFNDVLKTTRSGFLKNFESLLKMEGGDPDPRKFFSFEVKQSTNMSIRNNSLTAVKIIERHRLGKVLIGSATLLTGGYMFYDYKMKELPYKYADPTSKK